MTSSHRQTSVTKIGFLFLIIYVLRYASEDMPSQVIKSDTEFDTLIRVSFEQLGRLK